MKKTLLIALTGIILLLAQLSVYGQVIRNGNNILLAKIDPKGVVRDANGGKIGEFYPDGSVKSLKGTLLGKIGADGKVTDGDGKKLGSIKGSKAFGSEDQLVATHTENGTIKNAAGKNLGIAPGVNPKWALAYIVFFQKTMVQ